MRIFSKMLSGSPSLSTSCSFRILRWPLAQSPARLTTVRLPSTACSVATTTAANIAKQLAMLDVARSLFGRRLYSPAKLRAEVFFSCYFPAYKSLMPTPPSISGNKAVSASTTLF